MKKIIRKLLGYIIVAITMLMIIPFMIVFLFLGKRRRKAFYTWALCFFYPSGKQGGAISQLVKKCNYGQGEVFKDCELGNSFDIGNTEVLTIRSFLCV